MSALRFWLIITFLGFKLQLHSQVVRIPDPNFKSRLIALGFDKNEDNKIQASEALSVKKLYINDLDIVNLEGLSAFTNLEELGCYNNKITSLDVSMLKKLKYLYAYNNRISSLNIGGLTELEHLYIQDNFFITVLNVSKLHKLRELLVSNNQLTSLDVSDLSLLERAEGDDNKIAQLNLHNAKKLHSISFKNNPLGATVDISGLTELQYFNFEGCSLLYINFSGTVSLKTYSW